jgi:hypothetical protein
MKAHERYQASLKVNDLSIGLREREAAADLAAAEGDLDLEWTIRSAIVSYTHRYPVRRARISNYGWLVGQADADPSRFQLKLWCYKWVIPDLLETATVSRSQIESALTDLERRIAKGGESKKPVLKLRAHVAEALGDTDQLVEHLEMWTQAGRSGLNDCFACDIGSHVTFLVALERFGEALAVGSGMVTGETRCGIEQPGGSLANLARAAFKLGDIRLAAELTRSGLEWASRSQFVLHQIAAHIRCSLAIGDGLQAKRIIEHNLELLDSPTETDRSKMQFIAAADLAIRSGIVTEAFDAAIKAHGQFLAAQFDKRNRNSSHSDLFAQSPVFVSTTETTTLCDESS